MVNILRITVHITFLYLLLFIGNFIQDLLQWTIPGSVIGMLLFFLLLHFRIIKLEWVLEGTSILLRHITLFFIPVTIGFIDYMELFRGKGFMLLIITVVSTALVMGISGAVGERLAERKRGTEHE